MNRYGKGFLVTLFLFILGMIAAFAQAREAGDADFPALMARGLASLQARDFSSAREALERAVQLRPGEPEAHFALARAFDGERKYQFAARHLRETLKLSAMHQEALVLLGSIEEDMGRLDQAVVQYNAALETGPSPAAERGLASVLAKQDQTDEAIAALHKLVVADPSDSESRHQLGMVLMQAGNCEAAVAEFEIVLREAPTHRATLYNLGNCLNRLGRTDEGGQALEKFRAAEQQNEDRLEQERSSYFLLLDADKQMQAGDIRGALKTIDEAIALNETDPRLHAVRGQCLDRLGDNAGALAAFKRSAELHPIDAIIMVEIGRLLGKSGRMDEAEPYLIKAAELDPELPEPHLFLAALYQQTGRRQEALKHEAEYRRLSVTRDAPQRP